MPRLLLQKSFIAEHQRKKKDGTLYTVTAHYDKRVKKITQHAPATHSHDTSALSDEDKAKFDNMHKEQHATEYFDAHARRLQVEHHTKMAEHHNKRADTFQKKGYHRLAADARVKADKHTEKLRNNQLKLDKHEKSVSGIGALKDKMVAGSGQLTDDAIQSHAEYVEKLGKHRQNKVPTYKKPHVTENDDILAAIAKLGGLKSTEATAQGIDPKALNMRGHGIMRVFNNGAHARSYDEMAEVLRGHNFETPDANDLVSKVSSAVNQGEKIYTAKGYENIAEIEQQEHVNNEIAQQTLRYQNVLDIASRHDDDFGTKWLPELLTLKELSNDDLQTWEQDLHDDREYRSNRLGNSKEAIQEESKAEVELQDNGKESEVTSFNPTHELPDGTQVEKVDDEDNVYRDKDGEEYQQSNATPIKQPSNKKPLMVRKDAFEKKADNVRENKSEAVSVNVTSAPSSGVIKRAARGWNAEKLSDNDLIDAGKQALTANYLLRRPSKQPEWAEKSANRNVLSESGKPELISKIQDELKKRGLNIQFDIDISDKQDESPKDGDRNADGLVFRDGRWHRDDEPVTVKQGDKAGKKDQELKAAKGDEDEDLNPNSPNYRYKDTGYIAGSRKEQAAQSIKNAAKNGSQLLATDIDWDEIEKNNREAQSLITKANLFGTVDWDSLKESGMESGAGFLIDKIYSSIAKESDNTPQGRKNYVVGMSSLRDRFEKCKTANDVWDSLGEIKSEFYGKVLNAEESSLYNEIDNERKLLSDKFTKMKAGTPEYQDVIDQYNVLQRKLGAINFEAQKREADNPNSISHVWRSLGDRFSGIVKNTSKSFVDHVNATLRGKNNDWSWNEKTAKNTESGKRETPFQLLVADTLERKGGDEVNVNSTSALKDMFTLREVQSGNWVLKDKDSAEFHVQKAAEAFHDMASVLGVEPEKVSLNGRVALAFGARGHGSALAHYESVHRVINITKMKGGGSLGHEWMHSLDNMLAEMETGKAGGVNDWATEKPELLPSGKVKDAIVALRAAMLDGDVQVSKKMQYTAEDYKSAQHNLVGKNNTFVKNIVNAGSIEKAFEVIDTYVHSAKNKKAWGKLVAAYYHGNPEGGEVIVPSGEKGSSFYIASLSLDKGSAGRYWSQPKEMAARAFQAYIEDKLADKGIKNDYLSFRATNAAYDNGRRPFPREKEREATNAAFDKLFDALRESGTLLKAFGMQKRIVFRRKKSA